MKRLAVVALALAMCVGCGSKITKSNYDKIQTGMSQSQVESILGKGSEQASIDVPSFEANIDIPGLSSRGSVRASSLSTKGVIWQDGQKGIAITFINDKVAKKEQSGF